jgi:hypothetical protein
VTGGGRRRLRAATTRRPGRQHPVRLVSMNDPAAEVLRPVSRQ